MHPQTQINLGSPIQGQSQRAIQVTQAPAQKIERQDQSKNYPLKMQL